MSVVTSGCRALHSVCWWMYRARADIIGVCCRYAANVLVYPYGEWYVRFAGSVPLPHLSHPGGRVVLDW